MCQFYSDSSRFFLQPTVPSFTCTVYKKSLANKIPCVLYALHSLLII
jgi:hypothetical protein